MIGQTLRVARAMIEVLRPLTGAGSAGYAIVKATGDDVLLPPMSYAAPLTTSGVGSPPLQEVDRENLVRTTVGVVVSAAGALVPVRSILGGARQNLAGGTELRWDPPIDGVEEVSALSSGGATGGAQPADDEPGAVNQVLLYEGLGAGSVGLDLFRARAQQGAPAVVLTWNDTGSSDKNARGVSEMTERWILFAVVAHAGSGAERGSEGLDLLDALRDYLNERGSIGGFVFSAPPARVLARRRIATWPGHYVYAVEVATTLAHERIAHTEEYAEGGEPAEWERTRYDVMTGDGTEPEDFPAIENAVYPMSLDGFDDGFDDGFGQ